MSNKGKSDKERLKVASTESFHNLDFELTKEQAEALIDCVKNNGKISLRLSNKNISKLPGRGMLDDVDGEIID